MKLDYPTWIAGVISSLVAYLFITVASTGSVSLVIAALFVIIYSVLSAVSGELFSGYVD